MLEHCLCGADLWIMDPRQPDRVVYRCYHCDEVHRPKPHFKQVRRKKLTNRRNLIFATVLAITLVVSLVGQFLLIGRYL